MLIPSNYDKRRPKAVRNSGSREYPNVEWKDWRPPNGTVYPKANSGDWRRRATPEMERTGNPKHSAIVHVARHRGKFIEGRNYGYQV
jgi:hypothetical protein